MTQLDGTTGREAAALLAERREEIAERVTERHFAAHPELERRYGSAGRRTCQEHATSSLQYLEEAVAVYRSEIFDDYVTWATTMLEARGVPPSESGEYLRSLLEVIGEELSAEHAHAVDTLARPALERLPATPPASFLSEGTPAHDFLTALRVGGTTSASKQLDELMAAGLPLRGVYMDVIQPSLWEIGRLWQVNDIDVADEHYLSASIQVVMAGLYGRLFSERPTGPAVVLACAPQEQHEIGVRMVADLLQLAGYDTHFLGADTPIPDLVAFVRRKRAAVLGVSASTAQRLSNVEAVTRAVRSDPEARAVKILVGGAPFARFRDLWRVVGGDAFARDANHAVGVVAKLVA